MGAILLQRSLNSYFSLIQLLHSLIIFRECFPFENPEIFEVNTVLDYLALNDSLILELLIGFSHCLDFFFLCFECIFNWRHQTCRG